MDASLPEFEIAEDMLGKMLVKHGHPRHIIWTFMNDYAWIDGLLLVNLEFSSENLIATQNLYRSAGRLGVGVELSLVAVVAKMSLCSIWTSTSKREAELRMVMGLKLKVPLRLPK